jgi:ribose transport system substrate-binding protein
MKLQPRRSYLVALPLALLASCAKPEHQGERYVFISTNINIPYWQEAKAGFDDAGATIGVKTEFTGPAKYAPQDELTMFRDAMATRPSGILVSAARADVLKDAIDEAVQAGIPVICVDSDSPQSRRIAFIGTNNYLAGVESGTQMAAILHGRGHVVVVSIPGQDNQEERARGVQDAFKKYPYLSVTRVVNDNGDSRTADDLITGLLQSKESIDGIICLEASGGPGVAGALDRLGMAGKIPIVAMDANPETLSLISRGAIAVTVAQKPYTMGFYGLHFLDDLHHNRVHEFPNWQTAPASPLPTIVDTGTVVVNSRNIQDFLASIPPRKTS